AEWNVQVVPWAVQLQDDPAHPGQSIRVLVVGGTTGADEITVNPSEHDSLRVSLREPGVRGAQQRIFSGPIDPVVLYGQAAADYRAVSGRVTTPAELYGGDGDDVLAGGGGNNILVGGGGNDVLIGGAGSDLLIGSAGSDVLWARGGSDLLVGGRTDYDVNE